MSANGAVEGAWARLGVLLNTAPAGETPDLERLLIATASRCAANVRLFALAVTWLVHYGDFVAKHRLRRHAQVVTSPGQNAALGLLLDVAVRAGAPADLAVALRACEPLPCPRPLFEAHRASPALAAIARAHASSLSRRWGLWAPEPVLKHNAIRPVSWLLDQNPSYRDRIVRKGDLRCSIILALRHDIPGRPAKSESELARLCSASRTATRKAIHALQLEGDVVIVTPGANARDHPVALRREAA